jgi:multiple sugar transport system substrate-binding protein
MKNKVLSRWSLAIAGLLTLAGCNGGENEEIISFWAYQPSTQQYQNEFRQLIADFTIQSGIKVKLNLVVKDTFNTALNSAITGRSKPDISYLDQPLIADYASDGTIYPLTNLIADSSLNENDFYSFAYQTNIYNGESYGIPLNITSSVLFYNKNIVAEVPTTWVEWLAIKDNLPLGKSLFDGIGFGGYAGWYFQAFLANCGGKLVNDEETQISFNDEKGVEAAQMLRDLYGNDPTSKNNRSTVDAFGNGLVAFKLGSSSDIDRLNINFPSLDYGVALMPSKDGDISYSNMGGENLVVYSHSNRKEKSMQLIEYLMLEDNIKKISEFTGNFPAISEFATSDDVKRQVIIDQLQNAVPRPVIPRWIRVNDEYLGPALSDKILSDENPRDIVSSLNDAALAATIILFS